MFRKAFSGGFAVKQTQTDRPPIDQSLTRKHASSSREKVVPTAAPAGGNHFAESILVYSFISHLLMDSFLPFLHLLLSLVD